MAFTDAQFIALNLPSNTSFTRNGVTMSVADAITNALEENTTREGALAALYLILEGDQYQSETIGKYSYTRWGMRGSDYWRIQGAAAGAGGAPNVIIRPSSLGGCC